MARLFNYFLRGLVVVVPLALTLYVCVVIFTTIDSWLGTSDSRCRFPARRRADHPRRRARLEPRHAKPARPPSTACSSACRSSACCIRRRRTCSTRSSAKSGGSTSRCSSSLSEDGAVRVLAFLTSDSLASLGVARLGDACTCRSRTDSPGTSSSCPADRVQRIDADAAAVMAFIISGGVTQVEQRSTPV